MTKEIFAIIAAVSIVINFMLIFEYIEAKYGVDVFDYVLWLFDIGYCRSGRHWFREQSTVPNQRFLIECQGCWYSKNMDETYAEYAHQSILPICPNCHQTPMNKLGVSESGIYFECDICNEIELLTFIGWAD